MGSHKSAQAIAVAMHYATPLPAPPADLNQEEGEEWRAIVANFEAGKFRREIWPLLSNYCRLTVANRYLAKKRHELEQGEFSVMGYQRVLGMEQNNARVMATLATKLGISQTPAPGIRPTDHAQAKPPWRK